MCSVQFFLRFYKVTKKIKLAIFFSYSFRYICEAKKILVSNKSKKKESPLAYLTHEIIGGRGGRGGLVSLMIVCCERKGSNGRLNLFCYVNTKQKKSETMYTANLFIF